MRIPSLFPLLPKAFAATLLGAVMLTTGCGIGNLSTQGDVTPMPAFTIHGTAFGGATPIANATVTLYTTGSGTGAVAYGSGATSIGTATTGSDGSFSISPTYTTPTNCSTTAGPWIYATIAGGQPVNGQSGQNYAILLAAALGRCDTVATAVNAGGYHLRINEATSVATAYALNSFAVATGNGTALATLNIGTPTTNIQGLSDGFATANILVNTQTGSQNSSTATVLLPSAALASLANIISSCVNTSSSTSPGCGAVLPAATPPTSGAVQPANTFQALQNIARYPGNNVSALLNDAPSQAPFQPALAVTTSSSTNGTAPNDLYLGIAFPNATLGALSTVGPAMVIDQNDNVFILGAGTSSGSKPHYLGELSSASTGYVQTNAVLSGITTGTPDYASIDANNNIWMSNNGAGDLFEIPNETAANAKTVLLTSPDGMLASNSNATIAQNTWGLAIDGSNNVWTSSYRTQNSCLGTSSTTKNTICEYQELTYNSSTAAYSSAFTNTFGPGPSQVGTDSVRGMAVDGNGNIWAADYNANSVFILTPSTANEVQPVVGGTASNPLGIAIDASNNGWVTTNTTAGLYKVPAGSTSATTATAAAAFSPSPIRTAATTPVTTTTAVAVGGLKSPRYLAVDGDGNVFVGNGGYNSVVEYVPSFVNGSTPGAYLSPYYGLSPSIASGSTTQSVFTCTTTGTITCSIVGGQIASNYAVLIDKTGSVWTLNTSNDTLVEILGAGAPTDPVLSDLKYGARP